MLVRSHHVLNAFRHHGIGHDVERGVFVVLEGCSTPSGIMESVTVCLNRRNRRPSSAQRLPASWNRSQPRGWLLSLRLLGVLNAFRHHGIGHSWNCTGLMPPYACAQRLPASWNRSRQIRPRFCRCQAVLNAFRHHGIGHRLQLCSHRFVIRCSTPSGIMESVTSPLGDDWCSPRRVLNAFRHHGIGHSTKALKALAISAACSTPSGIMESVTAVAKRSRRARAVLNAFRHHGIGHTVVGHATRITGKVLNAFRHHGIGHPIKPACGFFAEVCSTPSGIMESVTRMRLTMSE